MFDSLGDRIKGYERAARTELPRRLPVIVRVDGKAFHSYTKGLDRPFDARFAAAMDATAIQLCKEIQGAQLAYIQSDEISVLVHNYKTLETQAWFDNQVQKMVSVAASVAAVTFTLEADARIHGDGKRRPAYFDARAFVLPEAEVTNYFLWRQNDATRNSIQMLARSLYSHKECHEKGQAELQEMCFQKGQNWNDLPTSLKRGRCAHSRYKLENTGWINGGSWCIDNEIPIFKTEGRRYIDRLLETYGDEHLAEFKELVKCANGSASEVAR